MALTSKISLPLLLGALVASGSVFSDSFDETYRAFQNAYKAQNLPESIRLAEKAWQLGRDNFGPNSESAAKLHFSYANVLAVAGKDAQAVTHFEAVADEYESIYGDSSVTTLMAYADIMHTLAEMHFQTDGRNKLSARLGRLLVLHIDDVDYKTSAERAFAHVEAAKAVVESSSPLRVSPSSLRRLFKDAAQYSEEEWGEADVRVLESKYMLAVALSNGREKDDAITYFNQVADIFDQHLTYTHPYELGAHARLVALYEDKGQSDKATEHCRAIGRMKPWRAEQEPEPLYRVHPEYPSGAARGGRDGSATLSFTVDREGFVRNVEVTDTKGGSAFGNEAQKALEKWRYAPKFVNGEAVESEPLFVQLDFKIER
ncbi:energy transducer TonB [Salinimonas chungwhensis]|uniref:energy transducer TonB n=1 Tax=Salinimonas chungwhensis TaxID=265425 RepID=UPI000379A4B7|nr:energy transducer TonB [Salinimonas chungwhensis]